MPYFSAAIFVGSTAVMGVILKRFQAQLVLARIAAIAFDGPQAMTITDRQGTILQVNQSYTKITGYSAQEVIGKNPRILSSGLQDAAFYRGMWDSINNHGRWEGEIWNKRKTGDIYPQWLSISAVKDDSRGCYPLCGGV